MLFNYPPAVNFYPRYPKTSKLSPAKKPLLNESVDSSALNNFSSPYSTPALAAKVRFTKSPFSYPFNLASRRSPSKLSTNASIARSTVPNVKIDISFDLFTGQSINHSLHTATTLDKTIGYELMDDIQANDLILRDMGYFSLQIFTKIEKLCVY